MQINSINIQHALLKMFDHHRYVCMNTYVFNGYEADFLSVTVDKKQHIYEIEVKVSVADFKKDFIDKAWKHELMKNSKVESLIHKNSDGHPNYLDKDLQGKAIHTLSKDVCCPVNYHKPADKIPNRFYFATPKGLLTKEMIPEYAGLIEIDDKDNNGNFIGKKIKEAPVLHKQSNFSKIKDTLLDKFWWETYNNRIYINKEGNWKKRYDESQRNLNRVYDERIQIMKKIDTYMDAMEKAGLNPKEIWQAHLDEEKRIVEERKYRYKKLS